MNKHFFVNIMGYFVKKALTGILIWSVIKPCAGPVSSVAHR